MKTAREMYQYCLENGYGEGMTEKWALKHFSLIAQTLQGDEVANMCFIGLHNYQTATKHDGNFAYAVTNKRIVMAQQKLFGQIVQTVTIDNLNDITLKAGLFLGVITIDTIKEQFNVAVAIQHAQNINEKIHDVLYELKEKKKKSSSAMTSVADEILKYKQLLDMGAITQDEYDFKKKELLNL